MNPPIITTHTDWPRVVVEGLRSCAADIGVGEATGVAEGLGVAVAEGVAVAVGVGLGGVGVGVDVEGRHNPVLVKESMRHPTPATWRSEAMRNLSTIVCPFRFGPRFNTVLM
jgi:hypothetical protein